MFVFLSVCYLALALALFLVQKPDHFLILSVLSMQVMEHKCYSCHFVLKLNDDTTLQLQILYPIT